MISIKKLLWTVVAAACWTTLSAQQLVINEVDYDQPGTDAGEFIELKNVSGSAVNLSTFSVELVNGNGGGATVYQTIALPNVNLAAGDYFVICADPSNIGNCDLNVSPDTNLIQNGAPDAVGLRDGMTLVDAVSYEGDTGAPYTETSGTGLEDNSSIDFAGISRFPDGTDTNQNNVDFVFACVTPGAANTSVSSGCASPAPPRLVINEIDYDQPSTDAAEFVEIANVGTSTVDLSGFRLELVNGTGGGASVYNTINLPSVNLAPGEYFVVCANAATVANCDLDSSPDTNFIQNGSPDAVAIATTGGQIIDTVSYEGDTGAPYTEGSGTGLEDDGSDPLLGISRFPDGTDTDMNNVDLQVSCITPGEPNRGDAVDCAEEQPATLVINEIDYDQAGTDAAEFIEIKNTGSDPVDLSLFSLELVNGTGGGASVYNTIALPAVNLAPGGYFVVCANAANTPNCSLDVSPDTNLIQNGAPDAVAITMGPVIIDTVSYEGDTGAPYTEGSGAGLEDNPGTDNAGISRFPDGADTDQNNVDLSFRCITPGEENTSQSSSCVLVNEKLVINEVDYDQDGTDTAEFIELKNTGTVPLDLNEFSLQLVNGSGGGASVYNTIALPAVMLAPGGYFVVCGDAAALDSQCDLDVSPDTNLIQNGAPDAIGLFRGADLVDALSYEGDAGAPFTEGSGTGLVDNPSVDFAGLSRFPDGIDNDQNNVDFRFVCITPGAANTDRTSNCVPPVLEIFEIQGSGNASPFDNALVTTRDNVVIALASNGFFMQTPTARTDGDDFTSDGIFVFTSSAPTVSVGDLVDVRGLVDEFFGLTEFTNSPAVTIKGSAALPAPAQFDAMTPSTMAMTVPDLERFEGMLVEVAAGLTSGPTDNFGNAGAVANGMRGFREPGILFPGLPMLPVWDGNPEVFELNPDGAGLPDLSVNSLREFSAVGALTFSFGHYQLVPTSLTLGDDLLPLPRPARARNEGEFALGTLNMLRLFSGQAETAARLAKFSEYIRDLMHAPDVLAVQEVDTLTTLQALARQIMDDDPSLTYTAYLVEGNDVGGIDVGFLVRDTVQVNSVTQIGKNVLFSFDGSPLNDRPPLLLDADYIGGSAPFPFTFIVVHQRSLNGIEDPLDGTRVKLKRHEQSTWLAGQIQDLQTNDPSIRLVVAGDFNAYQFTDGYVDVLGQVTGNLDPAGAEIPGTDIVDPDLVNQILSLPAEERYSFIFDGNAQELDHALTSSEMTVFARGVDIPRADSDSQVDAEDDPGPNRSSDHDGVVLYVMTDDDGDGVPNDVDNCPDTFNPGQEDDDNDGQADACLDACPGTAIPESVPTTGTLNPLHFALVDADTIFDTVLPPGGGPEGVLFTLEDTAGCSCEQIVAALGLGMGHLKHGCSIEVMQSWVDQQ